MKSRQLTGGSLATGVATLVAVACSDPTRPDEPADRAPDSGPVAYTARTRLTIDGPRFRLNGSLTYPGQPPEGMLLNVRMVNSVFQDDGRSDFDPEKNTAEFVGKMQEYVAHGVRAFTVSLQGGFPGYEGARNSAFRSDGTLDPTYLGRAARVIERADALGAVVILSLFYQRQDQRLGSEQAVRTGVVEAVDWVKQKGYRNIILEIANEYGHSGFDHAVLRSDAGVADLIRLAQGRHASLPVSASTRGTARTTPRVAAASDVILVHYNDLSTSEIQSRVRDLRATYGSKPIVGNEDDRTGSAAVAAMTASVGAGASYGLMVERVNQRYPFYFRGRSDDAEAYDRYRALAY
ncbi:MAG TPA: hypothetical protein VFR62_02485 [Gemmatimonadales bacterium]|nr:hypothetical protein [Gemmatimonadales bacterium]